MQDQVMKLNHQGICAGCLCSSQSYSRNKLIFDQAVNGELKILYVTPEFVESKFGELVLINEKCPGGIVCFAIDEAHCVVQWGLHFRPSYSNIYKLRTISDDIPFIAVTATASPEERTNIIQKLKLRNPRVIVTSFDRENLFFEFKKRTDVLSDIKEMFRMNQILLIWSALTCSWFMNHFKEFTHCKDIAVWF